VIDFNQRALALTAIAEIVHAGCCPLVNSANPDKTDRGWSPAWTYAVVPIAPMVPVPSVPMIVIVIAPMILSVALIMIAPMILVMIVAFRVALILIVPMIAVAFSSEGRYGKQQSACYSANERKLAKHWVVLHFVDPFDGSCRVSDSPPHDRGKL
jgi:hypothetical protein